MKKSRFLIVLVGLVLPAFMLSCNNAEVLPDDYYDEDEVLTMEREITFPTTTRSGDAALASGSLTVKFSAKKERIISYEVSPEVLKATGKTREELDDYLRENMGLEDYLDLSGDGGTTTNVGNDGVKMGDYDMQTLTGCLEYCTDKYTDANGNKITGRGRCKGNCWIDAFFRIVEGAVKTLLD